MSKKTLVYASVIVIFLGWVLWGFYGKYQLDNFHKKTIGVISVYSIGGRGNGGVMEVEFTYNVNGTAYSSFTPYRSNTFNIKDFKEKFLGRSFPVLYEYKNPSEATILITPKRFERYNLPFPDSLKWVLKSIVLEF